jgi:hypothetical protein
MHRQGAFGVAEGQLQASSYKLQAGRGSMMPWYFGRHMPAQDLQKAIILQKTVRLQSRTASLQLEACSLQLPKKEHCR